MSLPSDGEFVITEFDCTVHHLKKNENLIKQAPILTISKTVVNEHSPGWL
jgi:hypothetical protein